MMRVQWLRVLLAVLPVAAFVLMAPTLFGGWSPALAQAGDGVPQAKEDIEKPDEYAEVSGQRLLVFENVAHTLSDGMSLYDTMLVHLALPSVRMTAGKVSDEATLAWCEREARDLVTRRGGGEEKEIALAVADFESACSQVFGADIVVRHQCVSSPIKKKKGKKWVTVPGIGCKVLGQLTLRRYRSSVGQDAEGKPTVSFSPDPRFGSESKREFQVEKGVVVEVGSSVAQAADQALRAALEKAGSALHARIIQIRDFQTHAPVTSVSKSRTRFCLGRDTVALDTPFRIVKPTATGERSVGFVKAREIFDGCFETEETRTRVAAGKKVTLRELEAQTIIGGGDIKAGHTAWEIPSIGLNWGFMAGIMPVYGGFGGHYPFGGIQFEESLAKATGVSEFYAFQHLRGSFLAGSKELDKRFDKALRDSYFPNPDIEEAFVLQLDLGLLKRWYVRRFFFGVLGGLALSFNVGLPVETTGGEDMIPWAIGIGAMAAGEIGVQLTPGLMMALRGGYRLTYGIPVIMLDGEACDEETCGEIDSGALGLEHGAIGTLDFLFSF